MKKKVLIIVSYLSGGGAEHVARKNLEFLERDENYIPAVLTCDQEYIGKYPENIFRVRDFRKSQGLFRKTMQSLFFWRNYRQTVLFLELFCPSIIHLHDFLPFGPGLLFAIRNYKRKTGCKVILTHHTFSYICTNDSLYNYKREHLCNQCAGTYNLDIIKNNCANNAFVSFAKYIQKNILKNPLRSTIDLHLAPSEFMRDTLMRVLRGEQCHLVRNPCVDTVLPVLPEIKKDKMVYFGRISKEKNIIAFTKAFLSSDIQTELLIVGTGPMSDELSALVNEKPQTRVRFINKFMSTSELYCTIRDAKYFILPAIWYENSPVSIVEAINLGILPLVSGIGGMRELINLFGVGVCFDCSNTKLLSNIIFNLNSLWEESEQSMIRARRKLSLFTMDAFSKEMASHYSSVADFGLE